MNFDKWEPIYRQILADFGFIESEDIRSAKFLYEILKSNKSYKDATHDLSTRIFGRDFILIGPCISKSQITAELMDFPQESKVSLVTVGEGTKNCIGLGLTPSMVFTDLDGFPASDLSANKNGALVFIHAHGDNIPQLKKWVRKFGQTIIPTCQCRPFKGIYNWGGFTDGDRAYCTLSHFGARKIDLIGFDFSEPCGKKKMDIAIKKKKLAWAKKIIESIDVQ